MRWELTRSRTGTGPRTSASLSGSSSPSSLSAFTSEARSTPRVRAVWLAHWGLAHVVPPQRSRDSCRDSTRVSRSPHLDSRYSFLRTVSAQVRPRSPSRAVLALTFRTVFLAPLQEMPSIGRNPVYIIGLLLFVIFQVSPPLPFPKASLTPFADPRHLRPQHGHPPRLPLPRRLRGLPSSSNGRSVDGRHLLSYRDAIRDWNLVYWSCLRSSPRTRHRAFVPSLSLSIADLFVIAGRLCSAGEWLAVAHLRAPLDLGLRPHRPLAPPPRNSRFDHPPPPRSTPPQAHRQSFASVAERD